MTQPSPAPAFRTKADAADRTDDKAERVKRLVLQHQEYARKLCRQLSRQLRLEDRGRTEFDELMALANMGLVEAAVAFDDSKGAAFTTFAYYRVRGAIYDGLRRHRNPLPPAVQAEARRRAAEDAAMAETLREHDERSQVESASDLEESARSLRSAMDRLSVVFSLEAARESGEPGPVEESTAADEAEHKEQVEQLRRAVASLDAEEQRLLTMMYTEGRTLNECGEELKRDKSTLSRRHAKILDKLRQAMSPP